MKQVLKNNNGIAIDLLVTINSDIFDVITDNLQILN